VEDPSQGIVDWDSPPTNGPHSRPNLKDPMQVPDGPVTRSRVKKIKEAMQGLVQSTWAKFANLLSFNQYGLERRITNFNPCDISDRWGQHSLIV